MAILAGQIEERVDDVLHANAELNAKRLALELAEEADRVFIRLLDGGPVSDGELRALRRATYELGLWAYQAGWSQLGLTVAGLGEP